MRNRSRSIWLRCRSSFWSRALSFTRYRWRRPSLLVPAARSNSVRRASRISVSTAFTVWFKMLSAARTLTAGGVLASTMTFHNVETAAVDIWWTRPIDCEYATHLADRNADWTLGIYSHREQVQ